MIAVSIRKLIDYFCHLAVAPHIYDDIRDNDTDFVNSGYLQSIAWLKNDSEDLYDPEYGDVIRGRTGLIPPRASCSDRQ